MAQLCLGLRHQAPEGLVLPAAAHQILRPVFRQLLGGRQGRGGGVQQAGGAQPLRRRLQVAAAPAEKTGGLPVQHAAPAQQVKI